MTARFLHVSDLHVGTRENFEVAAALARLVEQVEPQLVVASGDLSNRGRRDQLEHAAGFLRGLGPPVLAVPGNHDLPYTPARFYRPWAEFEHVWETTEPVAALPGAARRRDQLGASLSPPERRSRRRTARASGRASHGGGAGRAARRSPPPSPRRRAVAGVT